MSRILGSSALALVCLSSIATAQDLPFPPGEGGFHWDAYEALKSTDLSGQVITVAGPWLSQERDYFETVVAYFEAATGADVQYNGSDSFEQQIVIDTAAGSPPDIAIFPQPGLAADLAAKGFLVPLPQATADWVAENYAAGQSWVDLATFPGQDGSDALYGIFYRVDLKSLVWYVPENFEDLGLEIPGTMEDLKAMTQEIVDEGETPWCIGLGSGGATGWPATDWVEDLMLRMYPPEVYDDWVANQMPFDDPKVIAAIEEFGWFARNDDFVAGGTGAVASTDFRDSPKGLFAIPPQCYLHRQASFIPSFFPEGTVVGEDADFFYFPSYADKDLGNPVLGAGTLVSMTKDSPGARAFVEFIQNPIAHEIWMAQRAFISAHLGTNAELYGDPTMGKMAEILRGADTFRFDGSDIMPAAVGAGVFWTGMVDYAGGADAAEVASAIQATWDGIK
ncbi:ABC transporter substrate-binding protein [Mangrovicoccus ximenensis]|uniref:ABC transporter substrate-binding protein n=1 Tax=Mangrovicoccus ximenensis TaxID=1911570 RepID=UPI000D36AC58|nr:ABC transporter substrate-binding protein [Mangrovicoccus ximenensis]